MTVTVGWQPQEYRTVRVPARDLREGDVTVTDGARVAQADYNPAEGTVTVTSQHPQRGVYVWLPAWWAPVTVYRPVSDLSAAMRETTY